MAIDKDLIPEKPIDQLYDKAVEIIETARNNTYRQINENLVRRNWDLGKLISEEEIRGRDRTELYGLEVIKSLSKRLTLRYGKGFTKTNLYSFTNFYKMFPNIFHSLSGKSSPLLSWTHYRTLLQVLDDASKYMLYLPTPEQLKREIERQKEIFLLQQQEKTID